MPSHLHAADVTAEAKGLDLPTVDIADGGNFCSLVGPQANRPCLPLGTAPIISLSQILAFKDVEQAPEA